MAWLYMSPYNRLSTSLFLWFYSTVLPTCYSFINGTNSHNATSISVNVTVPIKLKSSNLSSPVVQTTTIFSYEYPFETLTYPDSSLSSRCSEAWLSEFRTVATTYTSTSTFSQTADNIVEVFIKSPGTDWSYTPSAPCCLNCTINGGTAQIFYWPTPASTPGVATLTNSAGYTFVSPSIYVAFQSLEATNLCGQVGTPVAETTIAFAPNALSTSRGLLWADDYYLTWSAFGAFVWSSFVPQDLQSNCELQNITYCMEVAPTKIFTVGYQPFATTWLQCSSVALTNLDFQLATASYNPCSPIISVPAEILTIEPEWKACLNGIGAFYDPPYALTPASGFLQAPQTIVDPPAPNTPAQVGQSPQPPTAGPTGLASSTQTTYLSYIIVESTVIETPRGPQETGPPPSLSPLPSLAPTLPGILTLGSDTITENAASAYIISTQTLFPGGPVVTVSGTTYSLPSSSNYIVINGATSDLAAPDTLLTTKVPPVLTLASVAITANSAAAYVIGTQTLSPGGPPVTLSGMTYSLPLATNSATAEYLVINGITSTLPPVVPIATPSLDASSNALILDLSQTLSVGEAVTYRNEVVSLATGTGGIFNGTVVVISAGQTETVGLGRWITDGLYPANPFRGGGVAESAKRGRLWLLIGGGLAFALGKWW